MATKLAPPFSWLHRLHQVTGSMARRGAGYKKEDLEEWFNELNEILEEMKGDDKDVHDEA